MDEPTKPEAGGPSEPSSSSTMRIWGRLDAEDESNLPRLGSVSDAGLRNDAKSLNTACDEYYPQVAYPSAGRSSHSTMSWRTRSTSNGEPSNPDTSETAKNCYICSLPSELIDGILSYLSPFDLTSVSRTCRTLYAHGNADHAWQALIQSNIPGVAVTSPYPFASFRELYVSHDPNWFLPKYKLWFSGRDLTGKLIIVRYDQRRGCIEGYQMLAISNRTTYQYWAAVDQVVIHAFEPQVKLHLDKPVLQLHAKTPEGQPREKKDTPSSSKQATSDCSRFSMEIPMTLNESSTYTMFNNFMLARPAERSRAESRAKMGFPYGNIWPPPPIPARHRVTAMNFHQRRTGVIDADRPTTRAEISDQAFHIRSWMQMRHGAFRMVLPFLRAQPSPPGMNPDTNNGDDEVGVGEEIHAQRLASQPWLRALEEDAALVVGQHIGEEISTYSTLDPSLYTPTADKPWRGIWVGDYSGHGCEFLLINQPDDDEPFDESTILQKPDETPFEFEQRKKDSRLYRGRLEAIKLTGDPNVPRGEYTFVADDLGEKGFVAVVQEPPFAGARVVMSKGHVARSEFTGDKYIESQLLLISHDRLAQYWVGFGHISFFERVDIDQFLKP